MAEDYLQEKIKEFEDFMVDEYGKWKIGRKEAQRFFYQSLTQAYQKGLEEKEKEWRDKITTKIERHKKHTLDKCPDCLVTIYALDDLFTQEK